MFDIKLIRDEPEFFDSKWKLRGLDPQTPELIDIDEKRRSIMNELQELQSKRNDASKEIGIVKSKGGDASKMMEDVSKYKDQISELEVKDVELNKLLEDKLSRLPNITADDVPFGTSEKENVELRKWGTIPTIANPKEHFDIGEPLGMDFEAAARLSGARFVMLKGQMARLERAIGQFMLDTQTQENGYMEVSPPLLMRAHAMYGTGQLPKFEEDLFKTTTDHYLIPTAEVPLTNIAMDKIFSAEELPLRMTALTSCFRSEAGSAGKDTRGMIRQHQFYKVEMVSIVEADKSKEEHERMVSCAEGVLKKLELPHRTIVLCTGDMGFGSQKTYDVEVWLPGQNTYREISSCSNCGDFQARRMKARYKKEGDKKNYFVHTLNGSGLAVGRTLVAVLENYQQPDGSVIVPKVLKPYMGGLEKLEVHN